MPCTLVAPELRASQWVFKGHTHEELVQGLTSSIAHWRDGETNLSKLWHSHELSDTGRIFEKSLNETRSSTKPTDWLRADTHFLAKYWDILNEMFFKGLLVRDRCQWAMIVKGSSECQEYEAGLGKFLEGVASRIDRRDGTSNTRIFVWPTDMVDDLAERGRFYLGTLVHEMIHAVEQIYVCHCRRCNKTWYEGGLGGHALPFQKIARYIEQTMSRKLGLKIETQGQRSMKCDIRALFRNIEGHTPFSIDHITRMLEDLMTPIKDIANPNMRKAQLEKSRRWYKQLEDINKLATEHLMHNEKMNKQMEETIKQLDKLTILPPKPIKPPINNPGIELPIMPEPIGAAARMSEIDTLRRSERLQRRREQ